MLSSSNPNFYLTAGTTEVAPVVRALLAGGQFKNHCSLSGVHACHVNLLAGLFRQKEDLCAPYSFSHLIFLGC